MEGTAMSLPEPFVQDEDFTLYVGDALSVLSGMPDESVHMCITSPPYWGLRDYQTGSWEGGDAECDHSHETAHQTQGATSQRVGRANADEQRNENFRDVCGKCGATRVDQQLGLEPTPAAYVESMVTVFRELRRVLRADGTCWLNIGSSYFSDPQKGGSGRGGKNEARWSYGRAERGTGSSQSHPPQSAPSCGTGGTALQNSQEPGSVCLDLCDECLADFPIHHGRSGRIVQPSSLDEQPVVPTVPSSVSQALSESSMLPRVVPASTIRESSARSPALCWRCGIRPASVALQVVLTSSPDAQPSESTEAYMSDTSQPVSGDRSQGTNAPGTAWVNYTSKLKPKDLVPIPWMLGMALQEDGWYLRCDVIWAKKNCMPESVTDRPTKSHEYILQLAKSPTYFFDADAIRESAEWARWGDQTNGKHEGQDSAAGWIGSASKEELQRRATVKTKKPDGWDTGPGGHGTVHRDGREKGMQNFVEARGRNKRSVWEIATEPYPDAHFATFPQALVEPCVLAGTSERGCCPECGTPWARETERVGIDVPRGNEPHLQRDPGNTLDRDIPTHYAPTITTLGWRPTCECQDGDGGVVSSLSSGAGAEGRNLGSLPVPCTVLDPFLGSGTTALVARRLGRKTIGIELSEEYAQLAARRLQQLSLLA
jgi:DNA modification methylase